MTLYWTAEETSALREAQMQFWLGALEEFDVDIVRTVCQEWANRPGSKRPLPGDLRALCIPEHNRRVAERALPPPGSELSEEEKYARSVGWASAAERRDALARSDEKLWRNRDMLADGKAIGNQWAQERGYPSLDAYADAHGLDYAGARAEVCRSIIAGAAATRRMTLHPAEQMSREAKEEERCKNLWREPYSTPDTSVHDTLAELGITSAPAEAAD